MNIEQMFKAHTQRVLGENKYKPDTYNECAKIFADTKLIDISSIQDGTPAPPMDFSIGTIEGSKVKYTASELFEVNLPFDNCFFRIGKTQSSNGFDYDMYMFIRDYAPLIYTGTLIIGINGTYLSFPLVLKIGFNGIQIENDISYYLVGKRPRNGLQKLASANINLIIETLKTINKLSPKTNEIYYVEPTQTEYIRRKKNLETLKVNRPIYIYTDKKTKSPSFREYPNRDIKRHTAWEVRGHWRKLHCRGRIGKDRDGQYVVDGFTWVNAHKCGCKEVEVQKRIYKAL